MSHSTTAQGAVSILFALVVCFICFSDCSTTSQYNYPTNQVVINEVYYSKMDNIFWIELYNTDANLAMQMQGYYIKFLPKFANRNVFKIQPSVCNNTVTIVPPNGFIVVIIPSELAEEQGQLILVDPSQESNIDVFSFGGVTASRRSFDSNSYCRLPDGGLWSDHPDYSPTPGAANAPVAKPRVMNAQVGKSPFEIYVFNVGQGDSQLIRFPSGFSILVDVFESNWNSNNGAEYVAKRIREITGGSYIDVGVISHLHLDHLGYAGYGGFWHLIEKEGIKFGKIVDRDAGEWEDINHDGACDPDTEIDWNYVGTYSGTAQNWLCYATNPANTKIYPIREIAQLCSTTQINPPDANAFVQIITVDGHGATLVDGITPISGDYSNSSLPPSENDFSVGILIGFGNIRYVTMGDLDGDYDKSSYGYTYNNIEAVVAPRVGKVDLYHVNHHGSSHSSSSELLQVIQPTVSLISCGVDNSYGHPDQSILNNLLDLGSVYLTSDCDTTRNYGSASRLNKDIYVYSEDGKTYKVRGTSGDQTFTAGSKPGLTCSSHM